VAEPHTFASAARWSFAISVGQYGTLLGLNLILARLLGPEAFGLVAMATVYVLFIQLLLQQGMMPAIIQRPTLRPEHLDSAFWLVMATAGALTAVSVALSGWWADVNRLPELQPVIVALSLILPLRGLSLVQEALLRRRLDFKPLALRTGLAMTIGGLVAVALAIAGAGAWALVAQQVITAGIEVVVLWRVGRWRPRLRFDRPASRELLGFSGGALLGSVGVFANTRADALITGLFFGPIAVGWYRLGTRLTTAVVDLASRSLQQAALPELARAQHEPDRFRARTLDVLHLSALGAVPVLGVLAACTAPLLALLGPEWADARPGVVLLCWWAAAAAVMLMTGAVLQASGRPYVLATFQWGSAVVSCVAFVAVGRHLGDASVQRQVAGIALSRALLYSAVLLPVNAIVLRAVLDLPVRAQAERVLPAAIAAVVAFVVGAALEPHVPGSDLLALLVTGSVASAVAVTTVLAVDARARRLASGVWDHLRSSLDTTADSPDRPTTTPTLSPTAAADGPLHP
jgi:PST family polysaccharide transporter